MIRKLLADSGGIHSRVCALDCSGSLPAIFGLLPTPHEAQSAVLLLPSSPASGFQFACRNAIFWRRSRFSDLPHNWPDPFPVTFGLLATRPPFPCVYGSRYLHLAELACDGLQAHWPAFAVPHYVPGENHPDHLRLRLVDIECFLAISLFHRVTVGGAPINNDVPLRDFQTLPPCDSLPVKCSWGAMSNAVSSGLWREAGLTLPCLRHRYLGRILTS
jgi:hypothetical protein